MDEAVLKYQFVMCGHCGQKFALPVMGIVLFGLPIPTRVGDFDFEAHMLLDHQEA